MKLLLFLLSIFLHSICFSMQVTQDDEITEILSQTDQHNQDDDRLSGLPTGFRSLSIKPYLKSPSPVPIALFKGDCRFVSASPIDEGSSSEDECENSLQKKELLQAKLLLLRDRLLQKINFLELELQFHLDV